MRRGAQEASHDDASRAIEFWTHTLKRLPERMQIPTDFPRTAETVYSLGSVSTRLPETSVASVRAFCTRSGGTLFDALLSAWAAALARRSGQDEALIALTQEQQLIRCRIDDGASAVELVQRTARTVADAAAHHGVRVAQIAEAVESASGRAPCLQVAMSFGEDIALAEKSPFELSLRVQERGASLDCSLEFARELFSPESAEGILTGWVTLLTDMSENENLPVGRLSILSVVERTRVLLEFNQTPAVSPDRMLIHELFERVAQRTPEAVAVICEEESLTYADLNRRANQLARFLRRTGVGPDVIVGLCIERGADMIIGMLGILKAGGAYLPLDPDYPNERLAYMLQDSGVKQVLTQERVRPRLPATDAQVISIDGDKSATDSYETSDLPNALVGVSPTNLAFAIYTSGSTGRPKCAMNEHRGMVNRIVAQKNIEGYRPDDVCSQKTSLSFVDAVFETFGALCHGLKLVVMPASAVNDPSRLAELIAEHAVTQLITVPSLARSMLEHESVIQNLSSLRCWTLSGEEVKADLIRKLHRKLPGCEFISLYGASEVSSDVATFRTCDFDGERVPIGRPVPNVRGYVLDRYREPVPIGVVGELYVGGVGVGRGYLNRPELTAERFLPDPFSRDAGGRLYRTGDLARWRSDGLLEYVGRNDHQVKVRGFRVELGEIETCILQHRQVREAVVVASELVGDDRRLVAYVALCESSARPSVAALRAHLKAKLPSFMVPAAIVVLQSLPRLPNGKLKRTELPEPDLQSFSTTQYEAPQGAIERTLAGIWEDLLRIERIGRRDNFFELGGHSLLIVRMIQAVRARGLDVAVRAVYSTRTLAELALAVRDAPLGKRAGANDTDIPEGCQRITPHMLRLVNLTQAEIDHVTRAVAGGTPNIQDIYPLAPLQEGLLFQHRMAERGGDAYVASTLLQIESRERLEGLVAALQNAIDRHDALRTAFLWKDLRQPVQIVLRSATLPVESVALDRRTDVRKQLDSWLNAEPRIDLESAPPLRLRIAEDPHGGRCYALLQIHHIADDDQSLRILIAEIAAHMNGRADRLRPPGRYRDHIVAVTEHAREADAEAFFRGMLGDIDEPTAPFGITEVRGGIGDIEECRASMDATLAERLRTQAAGLGVSAATLFHAAWGLIVARTSGRSDVAFGSVLLGRLHSDADVENVVGLFINTMPLCLRLKGVSARALVEQTQAALLELLEYETASLAVAQRCSGIKAGAPLFTALLNFRRGSDLTAEWRRATGVELLASHDRTNYPLTLSVDDVEQGFELTVHADARIGARRVADYMQIALESLVEALEIAPSREALSLAVLPEREFLQVVREFNATEADYPRDLTVQAVFERQVQNAPDALAVIDGGNSLTYSQLNARANQLAHYLIGKGVGRGDCVPVIMERSVRLLIAQLAILKCGAAYAPIDTRTPRDRRQFMLADSAAKCVLSDEPTDIGGYSTDNPGVSVAACDPAYLMYTSGSTGKPKGVVIAHRGINRLSINGGYGQIGPGDRVAHCSNPAFDAATFEIWAALLNGATVLIVPQATVLDAQRLADALTRHSVTVLFLTTALFNQHVTTLPEMFSTVNRVFFGGEACDPNVVRKLLRGSPPRHLVNAYGPTESTTFATCYPIEAVAEEARSLPIGRPISNTRVYIVNESMQPVPIGVPGEICIAGDGVALGYRNQPELSAQRFVHDPYAAEPGALLYRSGDLGRWRADGFVEYLGRNDQQVKLRGQRIELGEIEAQLILDTQLKEAAVIVRDDGTGEKRLAAYLVAGAGYRPTPAELRERLAIALPEYAIPSAFVMMERLPLTANGKLDRRALPAPGIEAHASRSFEPPQGEVECAVAEIWRRVLRMDRVGRRDNFFELGGHSLLAGRVVAHVSLVLDVDLPLSVVFQNPTIESLGKCILQTIAEDLAMEAS